MESLPSFKKLQSKDLPSGKSQQKTQEARFWKGFGDPKLTKEVGAVTHIDICNEDPHHYAATSATRVLVYNGKTRRIWRKFARFRDKAYSGTFRNDGQLLVAGGEEGIIRVLDANSRTLLRKLEGHKSAVHVTKYSTDGLHVFSGSDDITARWWDISSGEQVMRLDGHRDYIRSAAQSTAFESQWATGGYDHVCRLWDVRSGTCTMELDHGAPVEAVAYLPSGTLIATAGGPYVCIWDILGSGQMLRKLRNHQKTVTTISVAHNVGGDSNRGPRLISGSLDSTIKVYDLDSFKVTFMSKYPAPILSMRVSPKGDTMVVGMSNGALVNRVHVKELKKEAAKYKVEDVGSKRHFPPNEGDFVVPKAAKKSDKKTAEYDVYLSKFRYKDAWDAVLKTGSPSAILGMVDELTICGKLEMVLSDREPEDLSPVLRFISKNVRDFSVMGGALSLLKAILDKYGPNISWTQPQLVLLHSIASQLTREVNLATELYSIIGIVETILGIV